jgi:hypothetical protein
VVGIEVETRGIVHGGVGVNIAVVTKHAAVGASDEYGTVEEGRVVEAALLIKEYLIKLSPKLSGRLS